jgi:DHA3 family tetracycline resistance protein-like MFS transporter
MTAEPRPPGRTLRLLRPLKLRDFRWLWTGMTVSLLGDGAFMVAVAWAAYQISDAPSALAMIGLATSLPQVVLLLVGGAISDRLDRRLLMVGSDAVRALAIGALAALALGGALELWHMVALTAVYGAATAFFGPAFDAIVPDVVPADQLAEANSLDQFVRPAALRLAGPALGGVVVAAAGVGWGFAINAASFAFSAACIIRMRTAATANDDSERASTLVGEMREGFRFVRQHVWLWGTFCGATISYLLFMGPTEVLLPYLVKHDIGGGAGVLGAVFAAGGVGALAAAVFMGQWGIPRRNMTFILVIWSIGTLAVAGYGLAVLPWQLMLAALVFNALETAGLIVWATTKHRLVPSRLLGRVSSVDWFISIGLVPLSFALTAPIAAALGARTTLIAAGVLGALVTFACLFLPGMRAVEGREGAAPALAPAAAPSVT